MKPTSSADLRADLGEFVPRDRPDTVPLEEWPRPHSRPIGNRSILRRLRPIAPKAAIAVFTAALWVRAVISWVNLYRQFDPQTKLGSDLHSTWAAEKLFVYGGAPYSVKAFVYPPSCLLLLRPIAALTQHQLVTGGLVATEVIATLSVMLTAIAIGARWWGPTAALCVLLVTLTGAMRGEMPLENLSILGFLALGLFFLFVLRDHWVAAGVVIGLSLSVKPLLLSVLIVFLLARRWKALGVAVGIPVVLNGVSLAIVTSPGQVLTRLPTLLDRTGPGVVYNSAWVDVARILGIPEAATILIRLVMVVLVVVATWLSWNRMTDPRLRIITATSVLLIGAFLAGTLSEYHFMLTLVPLGMTVFIAGSPMRTVTGIVGIAWVMDRWAPPTSLLGLDANANNSVFRAFGMSLLLLTVIGVLALRRRHSAEAVDGATAPVSVRGLLHVRRWA
ncbi:MAG: glycosyltransferase family 87 protein [Acidimicrobiales bacterium]